MPSSQRELVQDRAKISREKVILAAIKLFSSQGYRATSTREIESEANVKRGMISYHFGAKDELWKSAVGDLFDRFSKELAISQRLAQDMEPISRLRFIIRSFVLFNSRFPEVNRLMILEGMCNDWRLDWIVDSYIRDYYRMTELLLQEAVKLGVTPNMNSEHFYYIMSGGGGLIFSMAHEAKKLTGRDPLDTESATNHADALARILIQDA